MPNSRSAKKRLRQNIVRRQRNRSVKSTIRTQLRKVREALTAGDLEKGEQEYRLAAVQLDRAASDNVIHPNRAGRIKSRLQRHIKLVKQS